MTDYLKDARERMWRERPDHLNRIFPRDMVGIWTPARFRCSWCGMSAWMPKAIVHKPSCRVLKIKAIMGTDELVLMRAMPCFKKSGARWRFKCSTCGERTWSRTWGIAKLINRDAYYLALRFTDEKYYCETCGSLHTNISGDDENPFYYVELKGGRHEKDA